MTLSLESSNAPAKISGKNLMSHETNKNMFDMIVYSLHDPVNGQENFSKVTPTAKKSVGNML